MPEPEREKWLAEVGKALDRLPPHEFDKLVQKTITDEAWQERFRALPPEQRRKMGDLISQEKQLQFMLQIVDVLKKLPAPLRKQIIVQGRERMQRDGVHREITKERMVEHMGSTTPTQRAKFVRAMREMRAMLEEAGVSR